MWDLRRSKSAPASVPKTAEPAQRVAGGVQYTLVRRQVKNLNLRVRQDGTVAASAGPRVPAATVDAFVASRAGWVEATRRRLADRAAVEAALPLPEKAEALARMETLCRAYWPEFADLCPRGMPTVKVRDMTSRWGSCNLRTNTLTFSLRLCAMPAPAQEYVVVHEFSHFAQPNHSPAFWAVVADHLPDYTARRRLLRAK